MTDSTYNARVAEQKHLLQVYAQFDFEPVSASGVHITCRDGRKLLDLYGGHAVAALGSGHQGRSSHNNCFFRAMPLPWKCGH